MLAFYRQATDRLPTGYRHITNCRPTVDRLSADCRPTGSLCFGQNLLAVCRPFVGRQTADSRPTVGRQTTNSRPTVGRQLTDSRPTGFLGSSSSQLPSSLPYFWPDQKSDTLHVFMTVTVDTVALNIIFEGFFFMHGLIKIKMAKIDTLFMTKTAETLYHLGSHIPKSSAPSSLFFVKSSP